MNYSRRQLEALGEPFGPSCTRMEGGKLVYGSGGGGQSQRDATEEERRLWAAQARALEQMQAISMPSLQTGMNNMGVLANESMDGTLAERLRGMAGADASAAMGEALTGANQKLERFGATMNPNALGAQMSNTALMGASGKANAMNAANTAAEDVKWQRNAALAGLASGQGAQSVSGLGSLASQIGQNRMAGNQVNAQSLQGYGMMGAMLGRGLFGADGGYAWNPGEPRFASGGGLQMYRPVSMPSLSPMQFGNSTDSEGSSTTQVLGAIAQPIALQAAGDLAKSTLKDMGITPALQKGWANVKDSVGNMFKPGQAPGATMVDGATSDMVQGLGMGPTEAGATMVDGATSEMVGGLGQGVSEAALTSGAEAGAGMLPPVAAAGELGGAALTAGAEAGAGMLAPVAAGGALEGATAGSTLGPVGTLVGAGIGALTSYLMSHADGGPAVPQGLGRKDARRGGKVSGPGTETSDSIPAWLSTGEYVVNAEAMKDKKDAKTVERINKKGLRRRRGRGKKEPGFASGGMMRDIAMGPGTLTMRLTGSETDDLSTAQKIASLAGDPIGATFFNRGGLARKGG